MAKKSEGTLLYAALRGDVDAGRVRLEQLLRDAKRTVDDLERILSLPPYAKASE